MNAESLNRFNQAVERCAFCDSRCTATMPANGLAEVVRKVVAESVPAWWSESRPPLEVPPETLLLILTYSYACGVLGSQEIAEQLEDRVDRCALLTQLPIDARALAEFRRENRRLLRRCLASVLRRWNARLASPATGLPATGGMEAPHQEGERGPRPNPEEEAARRVLLAAQTDSAERDM